MPANGLRPPPPAPISPQRWPETTGSRGVRWGTPQGAMGNTTGKWSVGTLRCPLSEDNVRQRWHELCPLTEAPWLSCGGGDVPGCHRSLNSGQALSPEGSERRE